MPIPSGEKHHAWLGDKASVDAKRARATRLFELGPCERCKSKPGTDRHHRDGDTGHNERWNIAILCRRCHMIEDGRLAKFKTMEHKSKPPKPCKICGRKGKTKYTKPLRIGRCNRCAIYFNKYGRERPPVLGRLLRPTNVAPCVNCGKAGGPNKRHRCCPCYDYLKNHDVERPRAKW